MGRARVAAAGPAVLAVMKSVANLLDSFKKINIWHFEMLVEMIHFYCL